MKLYLQSFNKWLLKWKENPDMKGLSRPTFNAALQTTGAFPPLIDYLLDEGTFNLAFLKADLDGTGNFEAKCAYCPNKN